jgi:hypothetical protein
MITSSREVIHADWPTHITIGSQHLKRRPILRTSRPFAVVNIIHHDILVPTLRLLLNSILIPCATANLFRVATRICTTQNAPPFPGRWPSTVKQS